LVDAGMFQGNKKEKEKNYNFPINPKQIDVIIATHAHLDHI